MAVNTNKKVELEVAMEKAWNWLRGLSEYQAAYARHKDLVSKKEALEIWVGLLNLTEIMQDFKVDKSSVLKCVEYQNSVLKTWQFYPLEDPTQDKAPIMFEQYFKGEFPHNRPVVVEINEVLEDFIKDFNDMESVNLFKKFLIEELGVRNTKNLLLSIDVSQSIDLAVEETRKQAQLRRKEKNVKEERHHADNRDLKYKAKVYKALGRSHSEIAAELFPNATDAEAVRKQVARLLS